MYFAASRLAPGQVCLPRFLAVLEQALLFQPLLVRGSWRLITRRRISGSRASVVPFVGWRT